MFSGFYSFKFEAQLLCLHSSGEYRTKFQGTRFPREKGLGWVGLEPTTNALKGRCSTIELPTLGKRSGTVSLKRIVASGFEGRSTRIKAHFAIIQHSITPPLHHPLAAAPDHALSKKIGQALRLPNGFR